MHLCLCKPHIKLEFFSLIYKILIFFLIEFYVSSQELDLLSYLLLCRIFLLLELQKNLSYALRYMDIFKVVVNEGEAKIEFILKTKQSIFKKKKKKKS